MSKLSRKIAKRTHLKEADVRLVLQCMNECIVSDLIMNGSTSIPSVATFTLVQQKPRKFQNVSTGEVQYSKPCNQVRVSFYDSFKDKVNKD